MARAPLSPSALRYRIDAVAFDIDDRVVTDPANGPLRLSYRFNNDGSGQHAFSGLSGFAYWNVSQKSAVNMALSKIEAVADVKFTERTTGDANLEFFRVNDLYGAGGIGVFAYSGNVGGQIRLDGEVAFLSRLDLGAGANRGLTLHEVGHSLGLKHPGRYNFGGLEPPPPPYLPASEENTRYSIMSYMHAPDQYGEPTELMMYDIAALQSIYGVNTSYHTGNNVYRAPAANDFKIVWDAGGYDRIVWSGRADVVIDTRAGSFSDLGGRNNFAIAYGVEIEAAEGGAGDDRLIGGAGRQRLSGNAGDDHILGGGGDDWLIGGGDDDRLVGANGDDRLAGGRGDDYLNGGADNDRLAGGAGADRLIGRNGDDRLRGGADDDTLRGGHGADTLVGGSGNDYLAGGAGADVFRFTRGGGYDMVRDFQPGVDHVDAPGAFARLTITEHDNGSLLGFPGGEALLLGVDPDEFFRHDFLF